MDDLSALLTAAGLSEVGVLDSTGIKFHVERVCRGDVSAATVEAYADNLHIVASAAGLGDTAIPIDYWDVCTMAMQASSIDEYAMLRRLSTPEFGAYLALLGRCFGILCDFEAACGETAVTTTLAILREVSAYVAAGHCLEMAEHCRATAPDKRAIFLWQQVVTGTNREVPYLHRDAYTHGIWGRFNVVEMWRYHVGAEVSVDATWGLTGFAERFVGDATNTNQIEHMTISAVAQMVLGVPVVLLDLLEEAEWILRRGTRAASRADIALNGAVARSLRPLFRVDDPGPACAVLVNALAG